MEKEPEMDTVSNSESAREKFIAGAFILVCGVFSWFFGVFFLSLVANYIATGGNTPDHYFQAPMVYWMLFFGPVVLLALVMGKS